MILEVRDISKSFSKRKVLNNLSFSLKKGEILGLLGPNGVGKTTLLSIIMGFQREDSGDIFIDNESIRKLPTYKRVQKGLSYLPQKPGVIEDLSVKDNIKAVLQLLKTPKAETDSIIREKLKEFQLEVVENHKAQTLSGGERRKLEIILTLLSKPSFVLFDEPFTGLDPKTIKEIHALIRVLKKNGQGILLVDHHYNEVMQDVDRIVLLFDGNKIFDGTPSALKQNEDVRKYYLGEE